MEARITFIGKIRSALKRLEECPLLENENAPEATLAILPEYMEGIKDVKPGSRLILLTWLHRADRTVVKTQPRNNPLAPMTGVFSTRSPDRPNPIGIHFTKVISVLPDNKLLVEGLEVLDETPLIDIKPDLTK